MNPTIPPANAEATEAVAKPVPEDAFVRDLISRWYECAPYGEQVPVELPKLLTGFCNKHGLLNEEGMSDAFHDAVDGDPILELFECIFATAAKFTVTSMANAVFERDAETLRLIDIQPLGTLATPENDPNPECKHQHIMHPDQGGRMLFVATAEHLPPAPATQPTPSGPTAALAEIDAAAFLPTSAMTGIKTSGTGAVVRAEFARELVLRLTGPTAGDSMDVHYAELKAERDRLAAELDAMKAAKAKNDAECERIAREVTAECVAELAVEDQLRAALSAAETKAGAMGGDKCLIDWLERNPESVKYISARWYSGRPDSASLNTDGWSSTGEWLTLRDAIKAAIRDALPAPSVSDNIGKQCWEEIESVASEKEGKAWHPRVGDWFILKGSYCGADNEKGCTGASPCSECLAMSNRFIIAGEHYGTFFFNPQFCTRGTGCHLDETCCGVLYTGDTPPRLHPKEGEATHISECLPCPPPTP